MNNLGMGVMLKMLFGDDNSDTIQPVIGKAISSVGIDNAANGGDGALVFTFTDGYRLSLFDSGRSCCESRYLTTDDNLAYYAGATFNDAEVEEGPGITAEYGEEHETAFLKVHTSLGTFTVTTHNEHNGWYGGFWLQAKVESPEAAKGGDAST